MNSLNILIWYNAVHLEWTFQSKPWCDFSSESAGCGAKIQLAIANPKTIISLFNLVRLFLIFLWIRMSPTLGAPEDALGLFEEIWSCSLTASVKVTVFLWKKHFESWSLEKSRTTEAQKRRTRPSPSFLKHIVFPAWADLKPKNNPSWRSTSGRLARTVQNAKSREKRSEHRFTWFKVRLKRNLVLYLHVLWISDRHKKRFCFEIRDRKSFKWTPVIFGFLNRSRENTALHI